MDANIIINLILAFSIAISKNIENRDIFESLLHIFKFFYFGVNYQNTTIEPLFYSFDNKIISTITMYIMSFNYNQFPDIFKFPEDQIEEKIEEIQLSLASTIIKLCDDFDDDQQSKISSFNKIFEDHVEFIKSKIENNEISFENYMENIQNELELYDILNKLELSDIENEVELSDIIND